ncbi:hypothetical protein Cgig2_005941 [Carnegiea gigantea]|uniref:Uncharacterized protein n=1 Tax=Carnegiea gigantea TaxID=171969 RepID=A0A9Q1QJS0_9CARY|nr:hypothetical protein Cgig2_005941 [Carnegiea gigantea]
MGGSSLKRKKGSNPILHGAIHDNEDGQIDEAYAKYLHNLEGSWEPDFAEDNEDDPTYMVFLKNLKACGNAYMLDVSRKHGVSFPIRYEVENHPSVELDQTTARSYGSALIREIASLDADDDVQSGQENSASLNGNAQRDTLTKKRRRSTLNHELNLGLKNSGLVTQSVLRRSPRIVENFSNSRKVEVRLDVNSDLLSHSKHLGFKKEDTQSHSLVRKRRSSPADCQLNSSLGNSSFGKEHTLRHSARGAQNSLDAPKKQSSRKLHQEVGYHRSSEQGCMSNFKADVIVDESYRNFISSLKVVGDSVFYEYGDGKRVYYEGNDQERSSNVVIELQDVPSAPLSMTPRPRTPPPRRPTPPPPRLLTPSPRAQTAKEDSHRLRTSTKEVTENLKAFPSGDSLFWKAIEKDLRRPFDQKEYEDLLEKVNARKPISVHRETRRGGYKMEFLSKMGKSYLDSFPG